MRANRPDSDAYCASAGLSRVAVALAAAIVGFAIAGCGGDGASARDAADLFDAERAMDDVRAQVEIGPRPAGSASNEREARLIARSLRDAGVDDVRIQRPHLNVVGTIPGRERGAVVLGAHHDTYDIPGFVGANDGASGVAVVLELARSLPARVDGPDLRLALFDAEEARPGRDFAEDGTRGSRQYVRYAKRERRRQGSPPLGSIEAMVLFDLVGDCDLRIPREANSDAGLYDAFAAASEEADGERAPFVGTTTPISDDHLPFLAEGIPAVDLIDFTFGSSETPGPFWHTTEDTIDKVCAESLDAVGESAARALPALP